MDGKQTQDHQLIDQVRNGSVNAFEQLYRRHAPRVYGLCLRISDNPSEAQDCMQETFISAWQHIDEFRGDSAFVTWLHRIAVNTVLSRQRRDSGERRHLQLIEPRADRVPAESGVLRDLEHAIARLPERARHIFVLHRIYGYKHEEVADMLEIAVGTCKAQVHRAQKLLAAAMPVYGAPVPEASTLTSDRGDRS